jgi:proteic killer suppression protein
MIVNFKNKGLQEAFEDGRSHKLPQERIDKIRRILAVLDAANEIRDLEIPAFRLHKLKKPPLDGYWSIDVTGNYRIVFWFEDGKVSEVDYLDTH